MKSVALSEVKDDLSKYLRLAAEEEVIITRHGKAAGILSGFASEDDWFDYRLENDPRFMRRIADARARLRVGHGIRFEDLEEFDHKDSNPRAATASHHGRARSKRPGSVGRERGRLALGISGLVLLAYGSVGSFTQQTPFGLISSAFDGTGIPCYN